MSLICLARSGAVYDIDVRYAWGPEIFKQPLIDHGWSEDTIQHVPGLTEPSRHKLIVYLCEPSTDLSVDALRMDVRDDFVIGQYWQTVAHYYLRLPCIHPFTLPVRSPEHVLAGYSTTRRLYDRLPKCCTRNDSLPVTLFLPPHEKRKAEGGLRTQGLFKQATADKPVITVITVIYNGEQYVEQAIQSVINQTYDNIEYIVIDGGSSDGTIEIIKKYELEIDYWVSEPDNGIYDAMNKGTLLASGSHTLHINADDLIFRPDSLELNWRSVNYLRNIFYLVTREKLLFSSTFKVHKDRDLNTIYCPVCHQAFIGLRTPTSLFDESNTITADRMLMARKMTDEPIDVAQDVLAIRRDNGFSSQNNTMILKEVRRAIKITRVNIFLHYYLYCVRSFFHDKLWNVRLQLYKYSNRLHFPLVIDQAEQANEALSGVDSTTVVNSSSLINSMSKRVGRISRFFGLR